MPATITVAPAWPEDITAPLTYEQALAYLFHTARYDGRGGKYDHPERSLARMRQLLAAMGNPQERFQAVHIAGTKGKGSTSAMSESILRSLGYVTGLFTSPHLHTFRERIRVNGLLIGRDELAGLMQRLRIHFEAIPDLTVFDKITALAFQHFADAGVEWAVVEVGLGGRLDSTNVIHPAACGITRISLDHTQVLGDRIEQIAWEKAGIIKRGVPVFTGPQHAGVLEVFADVARERQALLQVVEPLQGVPLPLVGIHQQVNAAISMAMMRELARSGRIELDTDAMATGIARTCWPGRFELMPMPADASLPLLVDCAHNVDSISMLLDTLAEQYPHRPVTFVLGVNRDKQIGTMLALLRAVSPRLVLVQSRHPKALSPAEIYSVLASQSGLYGNGNRGSAEPTVCMADSMAQAVDLAMAMTPVNGLLVGTGSVFVVAELREAWMARYPNAFPPSDWVYESLHEPDLA